ncbi:hypothetical protein [Mesorhizobium sp. ES1-4]|uniref:hypothetical protein n=1 Tax=Mesorhizobium sp. ES1-4 TaxID=2876627 RepID=UPI001CCE8B6B|nr:hypothetical protein [Mesorhizobium sp. ES1-4]MBZ9798077.1 hypothetical protein [Mesorhizobium sp. ES1-4]
MTFAEKCKLLGIRRGSRMPPAVTSNRLRATFAMPVTAARITPPCGHIVNLDIFAKRTIFAKEGKFS